MARIGHEHRRVFIKRRRLRVELRSVEIGCNAGQHFAAGRLKHRHLQPPTRREPKLSDALGSATGTATGTGEGACAGTGVSTFSMFAGLRNRVEFSARVDVCAVCALRCFCGGKESMVSSIDTDRSSLAVTMPQPPTPITSLMVNALGTSLGRIQPGSSVRLQNLNRD